MGDPKRIRKKFSRPRHPWEKQRIDQERELLQEYGLKNKQELWRSTTLLKKFKDRAKLLSAQTGRQRDLERTQLLSKLQRLNLLPKETTLDAVLEIDIKNLLDRRLQTVIFKKDLARSVTQARQFIVHRHITVNGKKISSPAHLVTTGEESKIEFAQSSALSNQDHPERFEKVEEIAKRPEEEEELEIKHKEDEKLEKNRQRKKAKTTKKKKVKSEK